VKRGLEIGRRKGFKKILRVTRPEGALGSLIVFYKKE